MHFLPATLTPQRGDCTLSRMNQELLTHLSDDERRKIGIGQFDYGINVTHVTNVVISDKTFIATGMFKSALKRKCAGKFASDYSDESTCSDQALSDNEIDISSALTSKRARITPAPDENNDDDDLQLFLQESISRRDVKAGTEIVKKAKSKGKVAKGEVGGGSFQSMGQSMLSILSCTEQIDPK